MRSKREPLIHISRRGAIPWYEAWLTRAIAVVIALAACAVISVVVTGENPFALYGTIFTGAFGSARKTWMTLQNTAILLIVSLALTPAFRMRFWNIGGEGQVLVGCLASAACMILLQNVLPSWAVILCMIVASTVAGGLWALVPAFFKARWNTNETLFTLMMNYIATQLVAYFIILWEVPKGAGKIGIINQSSEIGWLPVLFGQKYFLNVLVAVILCVLMTLYLNRTKHGYELTVVGESESTARYIGINVKKVIIRTMLISGAVCGIAGLLLVSGTDHTISRDTAAGRGFTAIMVSWLAKFDPVAMILTSFLIVFLEKGATEISTAFGLNDSFSEIITGIIIFFIIGCEFFIRYSVKFRKKEGKAA